MKRLAAAAAAALFGLCGVTSPSGSNPTLLGQQVTGSPIRHVIVVVQENRTFDNLFASSVLARGGPYPGADASQTAIVNGAEIQLKAVPLENPGDPSHTHLSLLDEWDHGKMDGFAGDRVRTLFGWIKVPPRLYLCVRARFADEDLPSLGRALRAGRRELRTASRPDVSEPLYLGDGAEPHRRESEQSIFGAAMRLRARRCRSSVRASRSLRPAFIRASISRRSAICSTPRT